MADKKILPIKEFVENDDPVKPLRTINDKNRVSLHLKSGEVKIADKKILPIKEFVENDDPVKPLSFKELIAARRDNVDVAKIWYMIIDDPRSRKYEESMRLGGRIQGVIEAYETADSPKQRYQAGSELCRLVDRISDESTGITQGIQNGDKRYITHVRRDGEYRIPELHVVDKISPANISQIEFNALFPDKSGSMPNPRIPMSSIVMNAEERKVMGRLGLAVFLGIDGALAGAYDAVVKYNDAFCKGVKKE